jgi:hypothetical protein
MNLAPEQFVGAWSLVEWRIEYPDGRVTHPFGRDAVGQLMYNADGKMSATVSAAKRPGFGQSSARNATAPQKAEAFDGYFHYAGSWGIDGDTVIHTVEFALNPDMVGTRQRRDAQFDGAAKLTLSAVEDRDGEITRRHTLEWERD